MKPELPPVLHSGVNDYHEDRDAFAVPVYVRVLAFLLALALIGFVGGWTLKAILDYATK